MTSIFMAICLQYFTLRRLMILSSTSNLFFHPFHNTVKTNQTFAIALRKGQGFFFRR